MGKWIHRITSKDLKAKTGICAHCGPVSLSRTENKCENSVKEQKYKPHYKEVANIYYPVVGKKPISLTKTQRLEILSEFGDFCNICEKNMTGVKRYLDHCHITGKFRGMLCNTCNLGIGLFQNNAEILIKASTYLK